MSSLVNTALAGHRATISGAFGLPKSGTCADGAAGETFLGMEAACKASQCDTGRKSSEHESVLVNIHSRYEIRARAVHLRHSANKNVQDRVYRQWLASWRTIVLEDTPSRSTLVRIDVRGMKMAGRKRKASDDDYHYKLKVRPARNRSRCARADSRTARAHQLLDLDLESSPYPQHEVRSFAPRSLRHS